METACRPPTVATPLTLRVRLLVAIRSQEDPWKQSNRLEQASLENLVETGLLEVEILHPGGLALAQELAELCKIQTGTEVLDVACGTGETGCFLTERFGARVVGLDWSRQMIRHVESTTLDE